MSVIGDRVLTPREDWVYRRRQEGWTLVAMALKLKRSREVVRRVYASAEQKVEAQHRQGAKGTIYEGLWPEGIPFGLEGLSCRAANCVISVVILNRTTGAWDPSVGVSTFAELRALVQPQPYHPYGRIRQCGQKTQAEILAWIDQHEPKEPGDGQTVDETV